MPLVKANQFKTFYMDDDADGPISLSGSVLSCRVQAHVIYIANGAAAINYRYDTEGPDLLPLLIRLGPKRPEPGGKAPLQHIKTYPYFAAVPVTMLSASGKEVYDNGIAAYFKERRHLNRYKAIAKSFCLRYNPVRLSD